MASRRFFAYDPSDYDYPSSYHYPNPYYHHRQQQQPAPARSAGAGGFFPFAVDADEYYGYQREPSSFARSAGRFFPGAEDVDPYYQPAPARRAGGFFPAAAGNVEPARAAAARPKKAGSSRPVSIPVRFVESDPEPEILIPRPPVKKRAPSAEEAAVRVQAAARGFLARKAVRALRAVEREAEEVAAKVAREAEALRADARARIGVGEELMRLLLQLDAVRGAREYRKRVAKRVLALQDAVDALEQRPAPVAEADDAAEAGSSTVEMVAEEEAVAPVVPGSKENNGEIEENTAAEAIAEMEVDGDTNRADAEDTEPAPNDDAEGEWEMVAEEPAAPRPAPAALQPPRPHEPEGEEVTGKPAAAGGAAGVDANKLMAMVAALCEQSARQCAVIGALADRVDALERAVRRVEDGERRRRRAKKIRKEGKGNSNHIRCYSD